MRRRLSIALLVAILFLAGAALVVNLPGEVIAQSGVTNFNSVVLSGDLIAADDVTVGDDLTVGGFATTGAQTGIVVANNGYITPTGTYQPISAAGAIGTASIAAGSAGDLLLLINTGANTITLTDTGTLVLSGNAALGQRDSILLISDGTNWVEVAQTDN